MKLAEYQDLASRTAEPRAYHHDYLIPGIVGETGELVGHIAKAYWHGTDREVLNQKLMLEYGDICWQTALLLLTEEITEIVPIRMGNLWGAYVANAPHVDLVKAASHLYQFHCDPVTRRHIGPQATQIWRILEDHCQAITGYSFDEVLQANLDKLASRAARGVLQGSGDHR